jgi:hypothetical protein
MLRACFLRGDVGYAHTFLNGSSDFKELPIGSLCSLKTCVQAKRGVLPGDRKQ